MGFYIAKRRYTYSLQLECIECNAIGIYRRELAHRREFISRIELACLEENWHSGVHTGIHTYFKYVCVYQVG